MARSITVLAALALLACGSATRQPRGASDVLTRSEMIATAAVTAYDAIAQLRPHFFHVRGLRSFTAGDARQPIVYVNEVRLGGIEALRHIRIEEIEEIRYLDAADATTRHGTGHLAGVIEVRTYVPQR